jgi:type II secretory pathway predicted ATPase ExeA
MYEVFYGLKEKPFSLLPDPAYLFLSEKHQTALTLLEYSLVNQAGFCVISGVAGAGKTTLIRHLLSQFGDDVSVGLVTGTHPSFGELLRWILMAFELDDSSDSLPRLYQVFMNFLIEQYARNRNTVLIVDEAQNLSVDILEELRMLSNINADKDQVLQIILVGQPGLRDTLRRPNLEQFAQRIAVDYHIDPLSAEETYHYIGHRLGIAGGDPALFEKAATQSIYDYSGGVPRAINLLCEDALVCAHAEGAPHISARQVNTVVRERQALGLLPLTPPVSAPTATLPAEPAWGMDEVTAAAYTPDLEMDLVTSPESPVEEALAEILRDAQYAAGDNRGVRADGSHHPQETSQQGAAGASTPAPQTQAGATRERRVGVISKLVHLDAWQRRATDAGHKGLHVTRTEVKPRDPDAGVDCPPEFPQTQAARKDGSDMEFSPQVGAYSSVGTQDASSATTDVSGDGGLLVAMHEGRDMVYDDRYGKNQTAGLGTGGKWLLAMSLGFSGGLLVAMVLLVTVYFKTGFTVSVPQPPTVSAAPALAPAASAENAGAVDPRIEAMERERDAAIAQARALERERDAALAAVKVRELTHAAELSATKAREREKTATLEAIKAQERARAAELEAMVAREHERAAALAAASAQVSKPPVAPKPATPIMSKPPTIEAVADVPAVIRAADAEPRSESKPDLAPPPANVLADKPAVTETPAKFSANPCKGPSAKFLSTCKE